MKMIHYRRLYPNAVRCASLCFVVLWFVVTCVACGADDKENKVSPATYSAEAGVGVEYDSNVSVEEVDATSGEGD